MTDATPLPAHVIAYSDSTFTDVHEVVDPSPAPDCRGQFTHIGARFSGFETDRHVGHRVDAEAATIAFDHDAGHVLHIGLDAPAMIDAIAVSTAWFTGNQVPAITVELGEPGAWTTVLERVRLDPDAPHRFEITPTQARECRIRCHQEGGIARVHLFGRTTGPADARPNLLADASISHVSNDHYGDPAMAVAGAREVHHMRGWESARTGFGERALFTLAVPARVDQLVVDTYMHRLNPPLTCHLFGLPEGVDVDTSMAEAPRWRITFADGTQRTPDHFADYMLARRYLEESVADPARFDVSLALDPASAFVPLLPFAALRPDTLHRFALAGEGQCWAHLLFMFYPNGGIHGLRVHGEA